MADHFVVETASRGRPLRQDPLRRGPLVWAVSASRELRFAGEGPLWDLLEVTPRTGTSS